MKNKLVLPILTILVLVVAACSPMATETPASTSAPLIPDTGNPTTTPLLQATEMATEMPTTAQTMPPTAMPTMAPTTAPTATTPAATQVVPVTGGTPVAPMVSGPATVGASNSTIYGSYLVKSNGMSLYIFKNDTQYTSACSGVCATIWMPLLTNGAPISGTGSSPSMLGTIKRSDGSTQVTYNNMPLYSYSGDKVAGDTNGQGFKGLWYLLNSNGSIITATPEVPVASMSSGTVVTVSQNPTLGSFLINAEGKTLYIFMNDAPNSSSCMGSCSALWPPLLTSGDPKAGAGVNSSMLGTIMRNDGKTQVTYNGWPLYYNAGDEMPGDTKGENNQNLWFVVSPEGMKK